MLNNELNIVSFNVPFPPDNGGAVDVFYKLKSLSEAGVRIYLHTFEYGRGKQPELEKYCEKVTYYKRDRSSINGLRLTPYIVCSRKNQSLVQNLIASNAPILFEGIHTTYPLKNEKLKKVRTLVRMHNVEHDYYRGLSRTEPNLLKRFYYWVESVKLKRYQRILKKCDLVLSISPSDHAYFEKTLQVNSVILPAFHAYDRMQQLQKKGYFALFHGDLSIRDNSKAAHFLTGVFSKIDIPFIVAGRTNDKNLLAKIELAKNIQFIHLDSQEQLDDLIQRAHINVFWSSNASGVKIKLVNALFNGRFCLANTPVVKGSGLEDLCEIADDEKTLIYKLIQLMDQEFKEDHFGLRKERLASYDKKRNAALLLELLKD